MTTLTICILFTGCCLTCYALGEHVGRNVGRNQASIGHPSRGRDGKFAKRETA